MASKLPNLVARAVADRGHELEDDHPDHSQTRRWTCKICGHAVLDHAGNVYGSATQSKCISN